MTIVGNAVESERWKEALHLYSSHERIANQGTDPLHVVLRARTPRTAVVGEGHE